MGDGIRLGQVTGIPIRLHWSWFLILALITWTLAAGYFPAQLPEASIGMAWLYGLVAALLLFGSVLLHELSHALVAQRRGLPVAGITLHVFGGVSELEREPASPRDEFAIAIVGPLTSYAVAAGCWLAVRGLALSPGPEAVLAYLGVVNLFVGTFNLVPGFPLDGGRLLRSALWAWRGDLVAATRIASRAGTVVAFGLMGWGGLRLFGGGGFAGLWLILIGFFLHQAAGASYRELLVRRSLEHVPVHEAMTRAVITVPAAATLDRLVDGYFWPHHVASFPVLERSDTRDGVVGVVTVNQVKEVPRDAWAATAVRDVMVGLRDDLTIAPSASCWEALGKLVRNGIGRLVVLQAGRLVGYVSLKDVLHLLTLRTAGAHPDVPRPRVGDRPWPPPLDRAA